ncbi:hypothetical protein [Gandjariella thermophila]|uniref:Uncharacterized protein n=1 Tax=Gandjariella thermophila TaxID=1931992 RepID=A0A4D4J1R4_9PSEU|nr:hypothetical protein [Gandjariella thermophila]GDY28728.1 hypothetical protein GTS_03610 [Gandjariella thermophila]
MDVTFADLHAMEIELLPSREALVGFINIPIGVQVNVSPAIAVGVLAAGTTAATNNVQALVQN